MIHGMQWMPELFAVSLVCHHHVRKQSMYDYDILCTYFFVNECICNAWMTILCLRMLDMHV